MSDVPTAPSSDAADPSATAPSDAAPTGAGRQPAEVAEQSKRAILEAALAAFAEHGYEGASLRDIARRADATHGLIRHHFGSKDEVFRAVVDYSVDIYLETYRPLLERFERTGRRDEPLDLARAYVHGFCRVSARHPEMMRLLMHEGSRPSERLDYLMARIDEFGRPFDATFEELKAHGHLRDFDCDSWFLFVVTSCGLPFGLTAFGDRVLGRAILAPEEVEAHAERIFRVLFGDVTGADPNTARAD